MIKIKSTKLGDTRSCDFANVTKEQLYDNTVMHINDVRLGIEFIIEELRKAAKNHDHDKLTNIEQFHSDFIGGFKNTTWWDNHKKISRHHLQDEELLKDVNLIDLLEMIIDCTMAGMGRTGTVYPFEISNEVLQNAFHNTTKMIKDQIEVI